MGAPYGLDIIENCLTCKMKQDSFFCDLPKASLQAFDSIKFSTSYPEGTVLFSEGQAPRGIFMLCRGRVKLSVNSADGKTLIVKLAEPGEVLGLHAVVLGKPYELTAETLYPCQVNFIKREDFLRFLEQHGDACLQAAHQLSESCQNAYEQIRTLGLSHSAPEKLARLLIEWSADGDDNKDGIRVKVALTHDEIAQLIGTSRETVTRLLSDFRRKGIAEIKGATLIIRKKAALQNLITS